MLESAFHGGMSIPKFGIGRHKERMFLLVNESPWSGTDLHIGIVIGSLISLILMERIGRKSTIILAIIPKTLNWLFIRSEYDIMIDSALRVSRINAGIGCGMIYTIVPMYLGAVIKKQIHGTIGLFLALWLNLGMLMAYYSNFHLPHYVSTTVIFLLPILYLFCYYILPNASDTRDCSEDRIPIITATERDTEISKSKEFHDLTLKKSFEIMYRTKDNVKIMLDLMVLLIVVNLISLMPIYIIEKLLKSDSDIYSLFPRIMIFSHCLVLLLGGMVPLFIGQKFENKQTRISSGLSSLCVILSIENILLFILNSAGEKFDLLEETIFIHILLCTFGSALVLQCVPFAFIGGVAAPSMKVPMGITCALNFAFMRIVMSQVFQMTKDGLSLPSLPLYFIGFVYIVELFDFIFNKFWVFDD